MPARKKRAANGTRLRATKATKAAKTTKATKATKAAGGNTASAARAGEKLAAEVLAFRVTQRRRRAAAVQRLGARPMALAAAALVPARARGLVGSAASAGTLIAADPSPGQGASWIAASTIPLKSRTGAA